MPLVQYWYVKECPLASDCSSQSWKKAGCWGKSPEEAKRRCAFHLEKSSLHKLTAEDAVAIADLAELDSYEDEEMPEEEPHPKKKPRQYDLVQQVTSQVMGAIGSGAIGSPAVGVLGAAPKKGLPLSSSSSVSIVGTSQQERTSKIVLRYGEFQAALDSVNRAVQSAEQAHRLSLAASRAFADEVTALQSVRDNLTAIKETAEIQMRGSG